MESSIKKEPEPQKAYKAIISDISIQKLNKMKADIYKNAVPTHILTPEDGLKTVYSIEIQVMLKEIDRQINEIRDRILSFYNCL